MSAFRDLGHELLGSVAIGTTLGLFLAAYLRLIRGQLVVLLLALGFGLSEMLRYVRFDALLTFMVAGFIVQNLSRQGEKLSHEVEKLGSVVYVLFFATAGAHLDVPLLQRMWPVALVLSSVRGGATWLASRASSRLANDPPTVRDWGWSSMISQAGLALGVAAVIERNFPQFGSGFRSLSLATIAINEMVGPILFKRALDQTGETQHRAE
jgi:Kef-type K+ transport system membrane component KefB